MKIDPFYSLLHGTHDLSCAFSDLKLAARRFAPLAPLSLDRAVADDLAVAAVAFAIQLSIDAADRDPIEMRELEHALIARLTGTRSEARTSVAEDEDSAAEPRVS